MHRTTFLLVLTACAFTIADETTLSGDIGGMTLDSAGSPYVITDNVTVPSGKRLRVGEGSVLLFKPFTGVVIDGSLEAAGTLEHPVIFTSVSDRRYNPASDKQAQPFDWNGIYITAGSGAVKLANVVVAFSVYGVKSEKEDLIMHNATFNANGQFHFTINDSIARVTDGVPFDYGLKSARKSPESGRTRSPSLVAPIVLAGLGCGAGGGSAALFVKAGKAGRAYVGESSLMRQDELLAEYRSLRTAGAILCAVAGGALPTSAILFVRRARVREKNVSIHLVPGFGTRTELAVSVGF